MAGARERRHRSAAEALAANLELQSSIPEREAEIRKSAEERVERVRQEEAAALASLQSKEAELKRREPELRKLLQMPSVGIGDMPATVLAHILLTATVHRDENLLRHVSLCARVCPDWRRAVMGSEAYGRVITPATERTRVLAEISEALRELQWGACAELYLRGMRIGDAGAHAIAAALRAQISHKKKRLPAIEELSLNHCSLSAVGIAPIARLLPDMRKLKDISLQHNPLGDAGVAALAGALPPSLSQLYLNTCGMGDEGMIALARKLPSTRIQHLDCSASPAVGPRGWEALGTALPQLQLLENLEAGNTRMGNAGARALARGLPEAAKLREVYLPDCAIGAEGAVALAAALPKCEALALLSVRGNPILAAGQTALRAAAARDSIDIIFHSGDSDVDSDGYYQYDSGDDYRYGDHGTDSD